MVPFRPCPCPFRPAFASPVVGDGQQDVRPHPALRGGTGGAGGGGAPEPREGPEVGDAPDPAQLPDPADARRPGGDGAGADGPEAAPAAGDGGGHRPGGEGHVDRLPLECGQPVPVGGDRCVGTSEWGAYPSRTNGYLGGVAVESESGGVVPVYGHLRGCACIVLWRGALWQLITRAPARATHAPVDMYPHPTRSHPCHHLPPSQWRTSGPRSGSPTRRT